MRSGGVTKLLSARRRGARPHRCRRVLFSLTTVSGPHCRSTPRVGKNGLLPAPGTCGVDAPVTELKLRHARAARELAHAEEAARMTPIRFTDDKETHAAGARLQHLHPSSPPLRHVLKSPEQWGDGKMRTSRLGAMGMAAAAVDLAYGQYDVASRRDADTELFIRHPQSTDPHDARVDRFEQ